MVTPDSHRDQTPGCAPQPPGKIRDLNDYAGLIAQADQQQGISHWQDARRRLKKNPVAMVSLCYLVGDSVLALLTPLLPSESRRHRSHKIENYRHLPGTKWNSTSKRH